jgi:hypothetical protein
MLLVGNACPGQPAVETLHGFCLHALFVALGVLLAAFAATLTAATRVTNIFADELAAAHAVGAIRNAVFIEAHAFTS